MEDISQKQWDELFLIFLEAHGAKERLFEEHDRQANQGGYRYQYTHPLPAGVDSIMDAFTWCVSVEGEYFWRNLSLEWRKVYKGR